MIMIMYGPNPHRLWPEFGNDTLHLFGHVHSRDYDTSRSVSVAVDAWNYNPVRLRDILKRMGEH
jgi:calcineurin-like phosphoesterase family protein